eukprot:scaffold15391_cov43-Phaeocystis_antarctica.AAC.1
MACGTLNGSSGASGTASHGALGPKAASRSASPVSHAPRSPICHISADDGCASFCGASINSAVTSSRERHA